MGRLKVFRTTTGFHDAIVAAPSRPAALKAWGAKTDLFSMGVARQETDRKIIAKALERPGEVIRIERSGSGKEVVAKSRRRRASRPPSRARLTSAERNLSGIQDKQDKEMRAIERDLEALEKRRKQAASRHARARSAAELKVEQERDAYETALSEWED